LRGSVGRSEEEKEGRKNESERERKKDRKET
jgi:hypothetical protein